MKKYEELTIKIYHEHNGMTAQLARKQVGDSVIITDAWDTFTNKGPGVFIAGGAGANRSRYLCGTRGQFGQQYVWSPLRKSLPVNQ